MISDEELKTLRETVNKAADNYACLIDGEFLLLDKRVILELIQEVQDRRAFSNEVIKSITNILNAESYLAPYTNNRALRRPEVS